MTELDDYLRLAATRCGTLFEMSGGGPRICLRIKAHDGGHTDQSWLAAQLDARGEDR